MTSASAPTGQGEPSKYVHQPFPAHSKAPTLSSRATRREDWGSSNEQSLTSSCTNYHQSPRSPLKRGESEAPTIQDHRLAATQVVKQLERLFVGKQPTQRTFSIEPQAYRQLEGLVDEVQNIHFRSFVDKATRYDYSPVTKELVIRGWPRLPTHGEAVSFITGCIQSYLEEARNCSNGTVRKCVARILDRRQNVLLRELPRDGTHSDADSSSALPNDSPSAAHPIDSNIWAWYCPDGSWAWMSETLDEQLALPVVVEVTSAQSLRDLAKSTEDRFRNVPMYACVGVDVTSNGTSMEEGVPMERDATYCFSWVRNWNGDEAIVNTSNTKKVLNPDHSKCGVDSFVLLGLRYFVDSRSLVEMTEAQREAIFAYPPLTISVDGLRQAILEGERIAKQIRYPPKQWSPRDDEEADQARDARIMKKLFGTHVEDPGTPGPS